jgi:hypothetical protein
MGSTTVPATHTGNVGAAPWVRSRLAALEALGVQPAAAVSVVAHWARETGWGRSEYGFNIGNIQDSPAWTGARQQLADGLWYRAFPSLAAGVRSTHALLLAPRYLPAWTYLQTTGDGLGWYDRLMRAGWHPWSQTALDEYRQIRARVASLAGLASPPAPPRSSGASGALVALVLFLGALAARRYL